MSLRVAVVGSGPAGSSAAETLVKAGIETYLFERKLDNAKPCGGAIPLCMVDEFDLPANIIDRRVRKMKMISPSNIEVNIGSTLKDEEYIGMCRREVLDGFLRDRAARQGAKLINGTVHTLEMPQGDNQPYTLHYTAHREDGLVGESQSLQVDVVIGADGANSRIAKAIDAGDYNYAIAFQERIRLPADKMAYYEDLAEMYVGNDVSPDFYAWVFPKYDHVAVGTGTMRVNQAKIKQLQAGIRARGNRLDGSTAAARSDRVESRGAHGDALDGIHRLHGRQHIAGVNRAHEGVIADHADDVRELGHIEQRRDPGHDVFAIGGGRDKQV